MSSKKELLRKLIELVVEDLCRVAPSGPDPEKVVPLATKLLWLLNVLMAAWVSSAILTK